MKAWREASRAVILRYRAILASSFHDTMTLSMILEKGGRVTSNDR